MADEPVAPPLPDGSVDFNAIHAAARQGHDLGKAIDKALFVHPDKAAAIDAGHVDDEGTPFADPQPNDEPAKAEPIASTKKKEA